jgi:Tfp pilus assembly protein PilZ
MSEKKPQSYLYLVKPSLIKEWHPTKNGNLNPRNVDTEHDEKVWWLCENGHEWEATIKSRIEGQGCFVCVPDVVRENSEKTGDTSYSQNPYLSFQTDYPTTGTTIEYRKLPRYKNKATAIIEDLVSRNSIYAQMQNISGAGMFLETNMKLKQGEKIIIKFNKPLSFTRKRVFPSTVKWCKELADDEGSTYGYGLGVKFT